MVIDTLQSDDQERRKIQVHPVGDTRRGGLRGRLIAGFLAVALLPFLGLSFILTVSGAQSGRDTAIKQINTVLNYKRSAILIWGDALKAELGNVLLTESTSAQPTPDLKRLLDAENPRASVNTALRDGIRGRFHLLLNQSQYYDEFMILGLDGTVLVASNLAREGQNYSTDNIGINASTTGLPLAFEQGRTAAFLSPPVYNEASQRSEIYVSYPIILQGRTAIGVLIGRARITILNNILSEASGLGTTGKTYLAAVITPPSATIEEQTAESTTAVFRVLAGLSREEQGSVFESQALMHISAQGTTENQSASYAGADFRGDPVLGSYLYIPALQAYLLGEQSETEINRAAYASLAVNASVAVSSILVALFLALQVTRSIAKPLTELSDIASTAALGADETRLGDIAGGEAFGGATEKLKVFLDEVFEERGLVESGTAVESQAVIKQADEISQLAQAFSSMTSALAGLIEGLEDRVRARTAELQQRSSFLQASAEVSRATTSILDPEELTQRAVNVIGETFDFCYVGLFLVDDSGQWAVLRAGTGEAGQKMLQRRHRLPIGRASMIGWSISNAQPRIAQIADDDVVRQANPDLPETRSEAAIPLRSRGRVIGALSVQSRQINAFDETILAVLQSMADQLAVAIDNANLFAQSQEALLLERRAFSEQTEKAWASWLTDVTKSGFASGKGTCYRATAGGAVRSPMIWHPEMQEAFSSGRYATNLAIRDQDPKLTEPRARLGIPISVRGAVIGALSLARNPDDLTPWSPEEIAFLESIAEQLGVALDSARLYAETQLKAEQERLVSEMTGRMRASLDVESVVKTAAEEIFKALNQPDLPLESVVIELAPQHERESEHV